MGCNVHLRRSGRIRKSPQRHDPGFGAAREWKNDYVAIIDYIIQDGGININVDTDKILSLLAEWDVEYYINVPSTFHMREFFFSSLKDMILIYGLPIRWKLG